MTKRLRIWLEEAGADWFVKAEIDEMVIYEESFLDEWSARADADEYERRLLGDLAGESIERAARVADSFADSPSRTPVERAVARQIAKQIREGRA